MSSQHVLTQIFPKGLVRSRGETAGGFFEVIGLRGPWAPENCHVLACGSHPLDQQPLSRRASYLVRTRDYDLFFHVCKDDTKNPSEFVMGHICAIADEIRGLKLRRDALKYISQTCKKYTTTRHKTHQPGEAVDPDAERSQLTLNEMQDFPWLYQSGVTREAFARL